MGIKTSSILTQIFEKTEQYALLRFLKKRYYLLTSILLFLSFPSFDLFIFKGYSFFAWFSLIPLFLYIRGKRIKEIYIVTFITGLLGNFLTYNWVGSFGAGATGGYVVILLFLIPFMTVFFTLKILLAEILSKRFEKLRFIIYPSAWLLGDLLHSVGHLAFPWPYMGYSQFEFLPFIQIASIVGIMGVTFIIVMANIIFTDFIYEKQRSVASLMALVKSKKGIPIVTFILFLIIAIAGGSVYMYKNNKPVKRDLRVAVVQTCIDPWKGWNEKRFDYLRALQYQTERSLPDGPDFLVWSESATLERISYYYKKYKDEGIPMNGFIRELFDLVKEWKKPLLTGEIGRIDDFSNMEANRYFYNNAVLINDKGEVARTYSKIHLVPFGEWFPYKKTFPFVKTIVDSFGASDFVPGDKPVIFDLLNRKFGVLICYEGIFHRLCRKYRSMGVDYLVNVTNDGWSDSYAGHMQHFSASIFRAIENGVWFIRAGNTGLSAIIDSNGRMTQTMKMLEPGYFTGEIDFSRNKQTFYTKHGDVIVYGALIFLGVMSVLWVFFALRDRKTM